MIYILGELSTTLGVGVFLGGKIMDITIFLAQVIGWYLIIVSLYTLFRQEHLKAVMGDILVQRALLVFIATITIILGLLLVISHNVWVMGWPVIITIIGWLTLIVGILRLMVPEFSQKAGQWWLANPTYLLVTAVILLLIGLYLLYRVYF
ncbi:hypothetical protein [Legionella hackeliae]|uniref:Integral membrane protein (PIN domain superfamily) n=1 Tax=Legionella hackeliae TaxID=449 RepID=A0A0A8URU8_LEGHA|nr:hypothetical protein [Legionella hackeliae]KTD14885.1 Integral membrane protein (PIN domain superfamily) [Legionella hackeliae]CEK09489.1 conserved membrane protein of unknown function [Legionella hackeliae]STX49395.1 Integral membrane protein (PIN domain superfamily) [Legionella hackeliae]